MLADNEMLLGDEVRGAFVIDEIRLIFGGRFPFWRLASREQRRDIIEPEFGHAIVIGRAPVSRNEHTMALHKFPEARYERAERGMNLLPVAEELLVG